MNRLLLAAAICLAASPAFAVDMGQKLKTIDGKAIVDDKGKDVSPILGDVLKSTLLITDQAMTKDEKAINFNLALKIGLNKDVTFTPQELTKIEDMLWKYQSTLVAGQTVRLIDPTFMPAKEEKK